MRRGLGVAALAGLLCLGAVVALLARAGQFRPIVPKSPGRCFAVGGIPGPEDLQVDREAGVAWISSDDRRATQAGRPVRGAIVRLALGDGGEPPVPVVATPSEPVDFHPHGLSLYTGPEGRQRLLVINHRRDGTNTVEAFDVTAEGLVFGETFRDPGFRSPNDLVAVGPRSFYVGNDHGRTSGFLNGIETLIGMPWTDLLFFDGTSARAVADGLVFTNGMVVTAGGRTLWVAETTAGRLRRYDRDPQTNDLVLRQTVRLGTAPDNLDLDPQGRIWVAAHPKTLAFVEHAGDPAKRAPSQVLVVTPGGTPMDPPRVDEVFLSAGDDLSAASVGVAWRHLLIIGAVFDPRILLCETAGGETAD
jgi:arylesterase / paraoxonase